MGKSPLTWAVHISVAFLVLLWLFPTMGLLVSSFRTADQINASGWWGSLTASEQVIQLRTGGRDAATQQGGVFVVEGNLLTDGDAAPGDIEIRDFGVSSRAIGAYQIGETAEFSDGEETLVLNADGSYRYTSVEEPGRRGQRVFVTAVLPPDFTGDNYQTVLFSGSGQDNMATAFYNTLTVTIPATIIPILVAAFAAYALAWMEFPGRALLIAAVVGLLVVPLQL
ncbi:MAG: carbohydrate ABC transporter permease, partial [Pseudomonadota bacterium]